MQEAVVQAGRAGRGADLGPHDGRHGEDGEAARGLSHETEAAPARSPSPSAGRPRGPDPGRAVRVRGGPVPVAAALFTTAWRPTYLAWHGALGPSRRAARSDILPCGGGPLPDRAKGNHFSGAMSDQDKRPGGGQGGDGRPDRRRRQDAPAHQEARHVQGADAERRLHADGVRRARPRTLLPEEPRGSDAHHAARASARRRASAASSPTRSPRRR